MSKQLLRTFFGRKDDDWAITAMSSVSLERETDGNDTLYAIADNIFHAQPNIISTVRAMLGQSIVPVVAQLPGESVLRCLGTGFFVSCSGLLVTAAHVITEPINAAFPGVTEVGEDGWDCGEMKLGVMIPLNPVLQAEGFIYRDIVWSSFLGEKVTHPISVHGDPLKLTSDTAICQVLPIADDVPHQPLAIIQPGLEGRGMAIGKSATAIGYVGMQDIALEQEREHLVSGNFKFNLHVSTGSVLEHFPHNATRRDVPTPGGCFSASMKLPPGMSGSPVFDDEMVYVHGVVSRGWDDESGIAALGFGAMLGHALTRPIPPAGHQSLIDLQNSGGFGIPKLQGPGL